MMRYKTAGPTLAHEVRDDAVEGASLEVQRLSHLSHALLT